MDRRALRAQAEAAERMEAGLEGEDTNPAAGDDDSAEKNAAKIATAKEKSIPKPRKKTVRTPKAPTRMRLVWRVFNNSAQAVATFEYPRKAEAEALAEQLGKEKRVKHFVMPVKEPMEVKE
jgi:hypothetical protein